MKNETRLKKGDRVAPKMIKRHLHGTVVKDEKDGAVTVYWDDACRLTNTRAKELKVL